MSETPSPWTRRFDERLIREMRERAAGGQLSPAPSSPRAGRRTATAAVLVVVGVFAAAALGGVVPGVSFRDPGGEFSIIGEQSAASGPSVVQMRPDPGSAFIGDIFFDCPARAPAAECGVAGAGWDGMATTDARIFLRVTDAVATIESSVAGTRATRSREGFVVLAVPKETINAEGLDRVDLVFRGADAAVLDRAEVRLPLLPPRG